MKNSGTGHRRRLKDRFSSSGLSGFADYEILEFLLTFGIPRKDVKPLAKALLKKFGSLAAVLEAPASELGTLKGLGPQSAFLLKLTRETCLRYLKSRIEKKDLLRNAGDCAQYCRSLLLGKDHEEVWVLYLNVRNQILGQEPLALGSLDRAEVHPRRVVEGALKQKAAGVILAHNHPSGRVDPSLEDQALTTRIHQALKLVEIKLLDHLIVGKEGFFSFRNEGLLKQ